MSISIIKPPRERFNIQESLPWQQIGSIALIVGAFAALISLQMPQLAKLKHQNKNLSKAAMQQEEAKTKVQLSLMQSLPSFGFSNLIADWHFLGFLQYFGDSQVRRQVGYGVAIDYFDTIIDRDPRFLYAYYYLSNTASIYAGEPDRSVSLMAKGLKSFSPTAPDRGYYVWRLKAVDELLFLGKVPDAQKSMLTAAQWAKQYPDIESQNAAKISLTTAAYLARNPNSKQAQFDAWNMVLTAAVDETVMKRATSEIIALGGKVTRDTDGVFQVVAPTTD